MKSTEPQSELATLRALPTRRRYEVIETAEGRWLAASSEHANIIGEGCEVEDALVNLFEQLERVNNQQPRAH